MWEDKMPKYSHTFNSIYVQSQCHSIPDRNPNYSGIGKLFPNIFTKWKERTKKYEKSSGKKYAKTTFGKYENWLNLSQSPNKFNKKKCFTEKDTKIFPQFWQEKKKKKNETKRYRYRILNFSQLFSSSFIWNGTLSNWRKSGACIDIHTQWS